MHNIFVLYYFIELCMIHFILLESEQNGSYIIQFCFNKIKWINSKINGVQFKVMDT